MYASNNKGNTALHEAVIERHVFVVELLLLHGASAQVLNKRQCTAIDCAEQVGGSTSWLRASQAPSQFSWIPHVEARSERMVARPLTHRAGLS